MCDASRDWTLRLSKRRRFVSSSIKMHPSDQRSTLGE